MCLQGCILLLSVLLQVLISLNEHKKDFNSLIYGLAEAEQTLSGISWCDDVQKWYEKGIACKQSLCYGWLCADSYSTLTIFVGACSLLRRLTTVTTDCAKPRKACPVILSVFVAAGWPSSPPSRILCTRGICANNGRLMDWAKSLAPSFPKM